MSVTPSDDTATENPFGEPLTKEGIFAIESATDFWNHNPQLQTIYHTAMRDRVSPWGVLAACMAHRLSHVPPNVVLVKADGSEGLSLASGTSLNTFIGLVGKPGGGKSATFRVASDLIPVSGVPLADGTGQGIVKAFAERRQITKDEEGKPLDDPYMVTLFHRHSLTLHAPEVTTLNAELAREGSKTGGMMRSIWVGETVGMTNADPARAGNLPANMTRLSGIWGVQPHNATAIMGQADDGTPQRFLWVPVTERRRTRPDLLTNVGQPHPLTTFTFPAFGNTPAQRAMSTAMPREIRDDAKPEDFPDPIWVHWSPDMAHEAALQQKAVDDFNSKYDEWEELPPEAEAEARLMTMEAHALLMRIKLAAALGFLWGHAEPDDTDWALAGALLEISMGTAAGVWKVCGKAVITESEERGRQRGVELDAATRSRDAIREERVERVSALLYTKLCKAKGIKEYALKGATHQRDRDVVRDALRHLEENGKAKYETTLWYGVYNGSAVK